MFKRSYGSNGFKKGKVYLVELDSWYMVTQTGQKSWIAVDVKYSRGCETFYKGNGTALYHQMFTIEGKMFDAKDTDYVGIRKGVMAVLVGKDPDSTITTIVDGNIATIKIEERL